MMTKSPRNLFAAALVLLGLGVSMFISSLPQPSHAAFSEQGTWIPSSGVGGTANAVTLTVPNIRGMSDLLGVPLRFLPKSTNAAGGTTIAVNSFSAGNVLRVSTSVGGGLLVPIAGGDFGAATLGSAGFPYVEVLWDGTEFVQNNPATGNAAVGSEISLTAPSVPNGYLVENGSCISQTTYAALYAYYGGSGDLWLTQAGGVACSAGQFHLPFANGRIAVAANNQGSATGPLTSCTAGVTNNCGAQNQTLVAGQIPQVSTSYTPAGTISVSPSSVEGITSGVSNGTPSEAGGNTPADISATFSGTPATITVGSGSPSAVSIVPYNYQILKAVKY